MMKKISIFLLLMIIINSCSTYYNSVSLNKIRPERKEVAKNFAETLLKKCQEKDYSEFKGFNISKQFEMYLGKDSLKRQCERIEKRFGTITVGNLISAHTRTQPKDFMDIFNYQVKTEKISKPLYLHIGILRDKDFIDRPFVINGEENYYVYRTKLYKKSKKK